MNRGFVILAQNTKDVDYIKCAEALASSIKKTMPNEKVALLTYGRIKSKFFDQVIQLPYGDLDPTGNWKLINDWQVYEASPFDYTIKLEADLYLPKSIEYWWDVLSNRDLVISTTIRDFKQEVTNIRAYRRFIDDNKLPDCYNSITYFKKSEIAERFFKIVRDVFENWEEYKATMQCNPEEKATTDWVYAIASHIVGVENSTLPNFKDMCMVHMKQFINGLPTEDWTDTLIYEIYPHTLRINTVPQKYPFHYHKKSFADKILEVIK